MKIFRSLLPPGPGNIPHLDCLYLTKVPGKDVFDVYLVDKDGVVHSNFNEERFSSILESYSRSLNDFSIVENIEERDNLSKEKNLIVFVNDASADPNVGQGSALYFYAHRVNLFTKIYQSFQPQLTIHWDFIEGKPISTVEQIDEAVSKSHSHTNAETLDKLQDVDGILQYNGKPVTQFLAGGDSW